MSHNVERMFSVRQLPWHYDETKDRTTILDEYPQNWDDARKLAGLDWEPMSEPVYTLAGIDEHGNERYEALGDFKSIVRTPNPGAADQTRSVLAVTSDSYAIINHTAFGEILESVLQVAPNSLKIETGGCLEGGRQVWMLVKLDEPIILPGDKSETMPYLTVMGRHDSNGGVNLRATATRIVCANTFGAAEMEGERTGAVYTFRHTAKWAERIDDARDAVMKARKSLTAYCALSSDLLGIPVTPAQRELFVTTFIPAPPAGLVSERVKNNVERARKSLRDIIASPTVTGSEIENTAYGLVQAAGEYLDHVRKSRSWESKLNRTLLRPEPLKLTAVKLAREVASVS